MTSNVSSEMLMLAVNNRSSKIGGIGRINRRIVPNKAKTSHKSPKRSSFRILSLNEPMVFLSLILFREIAVTVDAIDPRENFRDRRIQLSRNLATDAAVFEQHPRQRNVFHDWHLMLLRQLADFLCVQTNAFCD